MRETATGEAALVQDKSHASQAVLDDCIGHFDATEVYDRLIFVCHSPKGALLGRAERKRAERPLQPIPN